MNELRVRWLGDDKYGDFWERECVRSIMTQVASAARLLHEVMKSAPEDAGNCEWGAALTATLMREFGEDVDTARDAIEKLAEVIEDSRDGNTFAGG